MPWLLAATLLYGCGGPLKYDVRGTSISPGSDAHVVAALDSKRNVTDLEVEAKNLTPPDRLIDGGKSYVIWTRATTSAPWLRLGALDLDGDGRNGKAKLTVAETSFDLRIDAEREASAPTPSGKTIFQQHVGQ